MCISRSNIHHSSVKQIIIIILLFPHIALINSKNPLTPRRLIPRSEEKRILLAIHRKNVREPPILRRTVICRYAAEETLEVGVPVDPSMR